MRHLAGHALSLAGLLALPAALCGAGGAAFLQSADAAGLSHPAKRVVWTDLDGDTWPDAVLDRRHVYWNRSGEGPGGRRFEAAGPGVWDPPPPEGDAGFVLFADVDGDGDMDAFWGAYLDLEKPETKDGEVVRDENGDPVPAVADPGFRNRLYWNDGTGHLRTGGGTGLEQPAATVTSGAFLDANRDGLLDVYLGTWYREYGVSYRAYSDRLYFGAGDGRFLDVTSESGVETRDSVAQSDSARPTYGVSHCDWDGDGDQDILVATYGRQANVLWRNDGKGHFEDVAPATGFDGDERREGKYPCIDRDQEDAFRSHGNTFDVGCADFDGDGDGDVLLGEITHWWAGPDSDLTSLLVNELAEEGRRFRRVNTSIGLTRPFGDVWRWNQGDIHVGWLDVENDGRLDVLVASGDYPDGQFLRIWSQREDGTFEEGTRSLGLEWEGSGSISVGDFDRDGDSDILVGRSLFRLGKEKREELGPEAGLWWNLTGQDASWIAFLLEGTGPPGPNRAAIGARVSITACGRTQTREVLSSRGHAGHSDSGELLFGLGSCRSKVRAEILWPDARNTREVRDSLRPGRYYRVEPGKRPHPLRFR